MKLYFNKFMLLTVVTVVGLLALTYYNIQLKINGSVNAMHLKAIIPQQKWVITNAPTGNIFNTDRILKSQSPDENKQKKEVASKDAYRLVGVFISGKKREALFSYQEKSIHAVIGETLASFGVVTNIQNNEVSSVSDDGQVYKWVIFPVSASPQKEDNKK